MDDIDRLDVIEKVLASDGAFAESGYLCDKRRSTYKRRLQELSRHLPAAAVLLDAIEAGGDVELEPITRHVVIRAVIDDAAAAIAGSRQRGLPLEKCASILNLTAQAMTRQVEARDIGFSSDEALPSLLDDLNLAVWAGQDPDTPFGRCFQQLLRDRLGDLCGDEPVLYRVGRDEVAALEEAIALLRELLPRLANSVLRHTGLIAVFPSRQWGGGSSLSQTRLVGAIFIAREMLDDPWHLAEQILHESLHQKLYDFRCAHSVLRDGGPKQARVRALWNIQRGDSQLWNTSRTLAAFHVYVHLALFARRLDASSSFLSGTRTASNGSGTTRSRVAMQRARYLAHALATECWEELGVAGQRLVEWLTAVLDVLELSPAPPGEHLHLLLDRSVREARSLQGSAGCDPAEMSEALTELARSEIATVRSVLGTMTSEAAAQTFDRSASSLGGDGADILLGARLLIAAAIPDAAEAAEHSRTFSSADGAAARRMVEHMIERSSIRFQAMEGARTRTVPANAT